MKLLVQEPYFNERRGIRFKVGETVDCTDEQGAFFLRDQPSAFERLADEPAPAPAPAPPAKDQSADAPAGPPPEEPTADDPPPAEPRRKSGRSRTRG